VEDTGLTMDSTSAPAPAGGQPAPAAPVVVEGSEAVTEMDPLRIARSGRATRSSRSVA